ncbi:bifunctional protein GlmU [Aplysia californica]|uniref:Bifunctional protein GlmU n=1 Tax=Aplysia californica TaxID=6500 RepID=A0ABM1AAV2_APLCA|nr:bifunctional protein GlmU [Aplysia californica]
MDNQVSQPLHGELQCYPVRLRPGQEVSSVLASFVRQHSLTSAHVLTCVGSVTQARLRMANAQVTQDFEGPFEIVSLVGTLSGGEAGHLHVSLSDAKGNVIGGHVISMTVFTTAEVMIGNCKGVKFSRPDDPETGYDELAFEQSADAVAGK